MSSTRRPGRSSPASAPKTAALDARKLLRDGSLLRAVARAGENTTIAVVATNARLTKTEFIASR